VVLRQWYDLHWHVFQTWILNVISLLIRKIYSDSKHHHKVQSPCRKKSKNGALREQSTSCNLPCIKAGQVYTFPPCVNNTIWTESYVQHKCQLEGNSLNTKQGVYTTEKFHNVSFYEIPFHTLYSFTVTVLQNVLIPCHLNETPWRTSDSIQNVKGRMWWKYWNISPHRSTTNSLMHTLETTCQTRKLYLLPYFYFYPSPPYTHKKATGMHR